MRQTFSLWCPNIFSPRIAEQPPTQLVQWHKNNKSDVRIKEWCIFPVFFHISFIYSFLYIFSILCGSKELSTGNGNGSLGSKRISGYQGMLYTLRNIYFTYWVCLVQFNHQLCCIQLRKILVITGHYWQFCGQRTPNKWDKKNCMEFQHFLVMVLNGSKGRNHQDASNEE